MTTFSNTGTGNGFVLPPNVTRIYSYAFGFCRKLSTANATSGVPDFSHNTALTQIDNRAFQFCIAITSLELPSTVNKLTRIFRTGPASDNKVMTITELKLNSTTPPDLGGYALFDEWATNSQEIPTIKVPNASVEAYKTATGWSDYAAKIVGF